MGLEDGPKQAEALELLLTGGTYRWKSKPVLWKERWRNLRAPTGASVEFDVVQEGARPATLCTSWDDATTDVDLRATWGQVEGERRVVDADPLGWRRPLETYRPILSYEELGGLLEGGPSHLYDAMAMVLGVEPIVDALKRIQARHKVAKGPGADLGGWCLKYCWCADVQVFAVALGCTPTQGDLLGSRV